MNPASLLGELRRRGIVVRTEGEDLRLRGPRGTLTEEFRGAVLEHKSDLLPILRTQEELVRHAADSTVIPALAELPIEVLGDVDSLLRRLGGEIVAVTVEATPGPQPENGIPRVCRACGGTSFWISHAGVVGCRRCHPPAGSRLVRVWLDDGVEKPSGDAP